MEFSSIVGSASSVRSDCAVVGAFENGALTPAAAQVDRASGKRLSALIKRGDFPGKLGETLLLDGLKGVASERVLLVGLGSRDKFDGKAYRRVLAASVQALVKTGAKHAVWWLAQEVKGVSNYYAGRFAAETAEHTLYRIPDLKSGKKPALPALRRSSLGMSDPAARKEAERGLKDGAGIAAGMRLSRDLANLPANVCTPRYLADTAKTLSKEHSAIRAQALDEAAIGKLKMGSFLSVARGSDEPPRLIVLEYRGAAPKDKPLALVGKGITFDSGGISIKPSAAMDEMKFDMVGAASVLGAFKAAATLKLKLNLVGVIAACENMPNGRATKPGDVVTSMSGQTIEVLNTDAEGRLVLADALTYVRRFEPSVVIDIATLTGACVVALGSFYCGLMSSDDDLADELYGAGQRSGDGAWRLPLGAEFVEQLKSNFADLANISGGREAGASFGGAFLSKFTDGLKWAHLDIAGTAWLGGAQKGATGRPVPLLLDYLLDQTRA